MLRRLPTYRDADLVRTRDPAVLATCHTVVDVGGEYDAEKRRFDHHQRGFNTTFPGRPTKLSSAGLVFLHFGRAIVAERLGLSEDSPDVDLIYKKLYENFVEALDAHDNGISVYDPAAIAAAGIEKRFSEGAFGLGAVVGRLNPKWNDPTPSDPAEAQAAEDAKFNEASSRIGQEFDRDLDNYAASWLPARTIVQEAFNKRKQYDEQGRILILEGQSVPWKDHLYTLEDGTPPSSTFCTPRSLSLVPSGASSACPRARTPLRAESRSLRLGEASGMLSLMASAAFLAACLSTRLASSVETRPLRVPRRWRPRPLRVKLQATQSKWYLDIWSPLQGHKRMMGLRNTTCEHEEKKGNREAVSENKAGN
ncbi:hypothetical protein SNK05_003371 [Fusarium graminearum]